VFSSCLAESSSLFRTSGCTREIRDRSLSSLSVNREDLLMTGLVSMLSNCSKAEKDRAELPDSLSSDLILPEKWLLTTLFPFLLLQQSLSSLSRVS
jgi:hypothetical protein